MAQVAVGVRAVASSTDRNRPQTAAHDPYNRGSPNRRHTLPRHTHTEPERRTALHGQLRYRTVSWGLWGC